MENLDKYNGMNRAQASYSLRTYSSTTTAHKKNAKPVGKDKVCAKNASNQRGGTLIGTVLRWLTAVAVLGVIALAGVLSYAPLKKASDFIKDELKRSSVLCICLPPSV